LLQKKTSGKGRRQRSRARHLSRGGRHPQRHAKVKKNGVIKKKNTREKATPWERYTHGRKNGIGYFHPGRSKRGAKSQPEIKRAGEVWKFYGQSARAPPQCLRAGENKGLAEKKKLPVPQKGSDEVPPNFLGAHGKRNGGVTKKAKDRGKKSAPGIAHPAQSQSTKGGKERKIRQNGGGGGKKIIE